jgi:pimeloyl-ACP methyl ester carboxylesterase
MHKVSWSGATCAGRLLALKVVGMAVFLTISAFAKGGVFTAAGPEGPAQTVYAPTGGKVGPVVLILSGHTGPENYETYAEEICKLGYYTVLLDGNDMLNAEHTGGANLAKALDRALHAPGAAPGKAAVIGFSLGGGAALNNAVLQPDSVSMVVAYYPFTRTWTKNPGGLVKRFQVPVLMLAGALDHQDDDCCVAETARAIEAEAKARNAQFELVIYPIAEHAFNLVLDVHGKRSKTYREDDTKDAWQRTTEMLKRWKPVP